MDPTDHNLVMEQLRTWNDAGATLLLLFTEQGSKFSIEVTVSSITDDAVSFRWLLFKLDSQGPSRPFVSFDGNIVIWLEGASFAITQGPKKSVSLARGPFRCEVTEIRESAF